MMKPQSNPLLDTDNLPRFSAIQAEHVIPAIDKILEINREELKNLLDNFSEHHPDWQGFIRILTQMDNRLSRAWSPVRHLNSVKNSAELREAYDACVAKLSAYSTEMAQNESLFSAYQYFAKSKDFESFSQADKKAIEDSLMQFKLNGIGLEDTDKQKFKTIKQELSTLKSKFEQNVLDATQHWQMHVRLEKDLAGLPDYARAMGKQAAKEEKLPGWLFTLDAPSYLAIMTFADNRDMRREIYEAYTTRASDQGPDAGKFDNSGLMREILDHRQALARLLGFNNYSELSIADKMAESTDAVIHFLTDLVDRSKPVAQQELEEVKRFASDRHDVDDLQPWDLAYFSEKLKQQTYGISQEELKPYFPAERVISGLFKLVEKLYGLRIEEQEGVEVWHDDVRFYQIYDAAGQLRGGFYFDLYARANKRGGAWMDECVNRYSDSHHTQTPVAYLTCNLTPPLEDIPALFSHDEVTTLFHEFGHGLHHMLTRIDNIFVSGINGVEWDAVELPSQFMENWCWQKEVIHDMSQHYETGEPLPDEMFDKLYAAKNFQSALFMIRQLEFSLFDFRLHMVSGEKDFAGINALLNEIRQQVAVVIPPDYNRFQNSFTHIFAGGYAAGYYSYKWAEVLSADAFARFEENGLLNADTGKEFMTRILEKGGSENAMKLFVDFRGREPTIDALLRHSGLAA